jgi:phosphatidylserine/phosphatidylglycerophosphate/cardiolipin synthase-like enzyme
LFSTRAASNAPDTTIEDAIVDLINRAVPGSRVRVAVFNFTRARPSAALIAAHRRGVDVQLVVDGATRTSAGSEVPGLITALGASRVTVCRAPGTACLGAGIMHHKSFLFSQLDDGSRNVVVQASHNLTNAQLAMHNNAVIVRGDAALFAAYERTFADLRRDVAQPDYYRIDDGDLATRAYFFPRASGDTVVSILDNATCDASSRILVAMAFFTDARIEVARALAARRRAGCAVTVVAGDDEIPLGGSVASTLTSAGVTLVRYPARGGSWGLHSKYVIIDAPYAGSTAHRRLVFTGSHNWTGPALDQNDETLLRVERDEVFNAFVADHARVRAAATRP